MQFVFDHHEVRRKKDSASADRRPGPLLQAAIGREYETVGGRVYLAGLPKDGEAKPQPVPPFDPCAAAGDHWRSAGAIGTLAAFEDHLARFPSCVFAALARARIEELRKKPSSPQQEAPPADTQSWTRERWNQVRGALVQQQERLADCQKRSQEKKLRGQESLAFIDACMKK